MKHLPHLVRVVFTVALLIVVWRNSIWPVSLAVTLFTIFSELQAVVINSHERRIKQLEVTAWPVLGLDAEAAALFHKIAGTPKHGFTFKD